MDVRESPVDAARRRAGVRPVLWTDEAFDDVLREMWPAGKYMPEILKALNALLPPGREPFRESQVQSRAISLKLKRPDGFVRNPKVAALKALAGIQPQPDAPPSPAAVIAAPPVSAPGMPATLEWTAAMDWALIGYVKTEAPGPQIAKILSFEFRASVTHRDVETRVFELGLKLLGKAGNDGIAHAYRLAGQRFWSRDDVTRAEALHHLQHNGFYYRFQPKDLTEKPALALLQDNRVSLGDMIVKAREHFGVPA